MVDETTGAYGSKEEDCGSELDAAAVVTTLEASESMDLETATVLYEDKVETGG